jgi:hypothetical protein
LSVCSYSYWAPSLPKLRFVQERLSDFQEQCAQLCQYCTIHWKELVTPAPPPHASLNPFMATSLPPFWHSLTPFKRVSDALWGGGLLWQFHTMTCAIFTVSIKNWGSDVAAQNNKNILAYNPPIFDAHSQNCTIHYKEIVTTAFTPPPPQRSANSF